MSVRAGGKVGGVRYAASSSDVPIVPEGARTASGRIDGKRYASSRPYVFVDVGDQRISGGKRGGVRYASRGFGYPTSLLFLSNPAISSVTASGFDVSARVTLAGTASLVVTSGEASQPLDAAFEASIEQLSVEADVPFTFDHTGESGGELRRAWIQVNDGSRRVTSSAPVLVPHAGHSSVVVTSLAAAQNRLIAISPDIQVGEVIEWAVLTGTGTVVVNADASFDAARTVKTWGGYVGNITTGWRSLDDTQQMLSPAAGLFVNNIF